MQVQSDCVRSPGTGVTTTGTICSLQSTLPMRQKDGQLSETSLHEAAFINYSCLTRLRSVTTAEHKVCHISLHLRASPGVGGRLGKSGGHRLRNCLRYASVFQLRHSTFVGQQFLQYEGDLLKVLAAIGNEKFC